MEDNIRYISFGIKDIVNQLEQLNMTLFQLISAFPRRNNDENDMPL